MRVSIAFNRFNEVNTTRTCLAAALTLLLVALAPWNANAGETIFTANPFYVTAYPAGSSGNLAPIVPPTSMMNPGGVARDSSGRICVTNLIWLFERRWRLMRCRAMLETSFGPYWLGTRPRGGVDCEPGVG